MNDSRESRNSLALDWIMKKGFTHVVKHDYLPIFAIVKNDAHIAEEHEQKRNHGCGDETEPQCVHRDVGLVIPELGVGKSAHSSVDITRRFNFQKSN